MQTQYETLRKITETNLTGKQQRGVACCDPWATADHRKSSVFAAAAIQSPGTTERTCLQCARVLMRSVRWQSGAVRLLRDGHTHTQPTKNGCYSNAQTLSPIQYSLLIQPLDRIDFAKRSFRCAVWNSLPASVFRSDSLPVFKSRLKSSYFV